MERERVLTDRDRLNYIEHTLSQRMQDALLPHPPTPSVTRILQTIEEELTRARPQGETPFEVRNSEAYIFLRNNTFRIHIYKKGDRRGKIVILYTSRELNRIARFRQRLREIREILEEAVNTTAAKASEVALMSDTRGTERGTVPRRGPIQLPQGLARKIESFLTGETPKERASRTRRGEGGKRLRRRRRTLRK